MKILCVEDGSVDVDDLASWCADNNIKLVIYRAGATLPYVLDLDDPKQNNINNISPTCPTNADQYFSERPLLFPQTLCAQTLDNNEGSNC